MEHVATSGRDGAAGWSRKAVPAVSDPILVIDDDPSFAVLIERHLRSGDFEVEMAGTAAEALARLKEVTPAAILLDMSLPDVAGLELLEIFRQRMRHVPVVMVTADESVQSVVAAMQIGAFDYLTKPIDRTHLMTTLRNAIEREQLSARVEQLEREVGGGYPGIHGASASMREMFRRMDRLAATDVTALVRGESGTGKELVARAIHDASGRAAGRFVAVNCAAIPETLQEAHLFGHEKGAFTGADRQRPGTFEQADGGTLLLDEIAELSPAAQAKLLRAIQERRFRRVGGDREIEADFRLLAATHRDLGAAVADGSFREDLFYRVAVFELDVPPLRERPGDIAVLAMKFIHDFAADLGVDEVRLSEGALSALEAHTWPGNVRELQNAIQHALVVADNQCIELQDLPPRVRRTGPPLGPESVAEAPAGEPEPEPRTLQDVEARAIRDALDRCGGNASAAIRELGIGRATFYRKLKKYGLR